jgi:hypothetical protein
MFTGDPTVFSLAKRDWSLWYCALDNWLAEVDDDDDSSDFFCGLFEKSWRTLTFS